MKNPLLIAAERLERSVRRNIPLPSVRAVAFGEEVHLFWSSFRHSAKVEITITNEGITLDHNGIMTHFDCNEKNAANRALMLLLGPRKKETTE